MVQRGKHCWVKLEKSENQTFYVPALLYRNTKVNHAQLDQLNIGSQLKPYALVTFRWIAQVNAALCFGSQKANFMNNFKKPTCNRI